MPTAPQHVIVISAGMGGLLVADLCAKVTIVERDLAGRLSPAQGNPAGGRHPHGSLAEASLRRRPQHRREVSRAKATAIAVAISVATVNSGLLLCAREGKAEEMASGGSLSFFADEQDARILLGRLNADPEIAFIVPDGPRLPPPNELRPASPPTGRTTGLVAKLEFAPCGWGSDGYSDGYWQRWRAVRPVDGLKDGDHTLWHISAGPLVSDIGPGRERQPIPDPWVGWTSERPVCQPNLMPASTIRLKLVTRYAAYTREERTTLRTLISYWIKGDLLVASGFQWTGGSLQTARWMASLEDWFSRNAVGLHDDRGIQVFWAFPSALQLLKSGLPYDSRNFDLDESIRGAR
jgi:hypothetical protein